MYGKSRNLNESPSEAQAREKLALYVYEYLMNVGAQKTAQIFLSEIRWEKNITLGAPPGFLHMWWNVFWDLYCAAPDPEQFNRSTAAKALHDHMSSVYDVNDTNRNVGPGVARSSIEQFPPNEGIPSGSMPPNSRLRPSPATHPISQQSPHPPHSPHPQPLSSHNQIMPGQSQPFMGVPPRMNPRMNLPRGPMPGAYGIRGPPPGAAGMPMGMARGGRPHWQPNTSTPMNLPSSSNYSSSSPGQYSGMPIMPSHQNPLNSNADNMHTLMKKSERNMGGMNEFKQEIKQEFDQGIKQEFKEELKQEFDQEFDQGIKQEFKQELEHEFKQEFPTSSSDEAASAQMNGSNPMGNVFSSNDLNGTKNAAAIGGPGTFREDSSSGMGGSGMGGSGMGEYNLSSFSGSVENNQNESAAILKIKKSMQEEAKRFEKDSDSPDYFMQ